MQDFDLQVRFVASSDAEASQAASGLCDSLNQKGSECDLVADENTQDVGTIVGIVLGSAALIEIARGIADYVRRYNVSDIEVVGKTGTVKISNVHKKELPQLLEQISKVLD